jgi:Protein of unknown function (DUF4233)
MRVLGSSVLALEAIVVLLAIPIAINNENINPGLALGVGFAIALLMFITIGFITKPIAVPVGWVLQGLAVGSGFIVPTMFIVGGTFAVLWFFAVKNGQRIDRARELGESSA